MAGQGGHHAPSVGTRHLAALVSLLLCGAYGSAPEASAEPPAIQPETPSPDPIDLWARGPARAFLATSIDVGVLYLRPRFSAGYGRPYHRWVGLDANPTVSAAAVGGYLGLRFALEDIDLRLGGRFSHSFRRSFLVPADRYDRDDIETFDDDNAEYLALETELTWTLHLGPGALTSETSATYTALVPEDRFVFEERLRLVTAPDWLWRTRLAYPIGIFPDTPLWIGPVVELLGIPGRAEHILRGGFIGRFAIDEQIEVRGAFLPVWTSPDQLGIAGGEVGLLTVRFRWATGMRDEGP